MTLFVVRHHHDPRRCPGRDPSLAAALVSCLDRSHLSKQGVELRGEAVVQDDHTLYVVVDSIDDHHVREAVSPLELFGEVEVHPAASCARLLAGGDCGNAPSALDRGLSEMDPEQACERALAAGLVIHRVHPLNCETFISALIGGIVMPSAHFYVRNHFSIPLLDPATFRLEVSGLVERPLSLGLHDLHAMRSTSEIVTLECAGNGRTMMNPATPGEPWELGAVSTAEWTGVPLAEVLERARVRPEARELVFGGADKGPIENRGEVRFERSLSTDAARTSEAILAYAMNGEEIPPQHGYPLRLVVPGWYGVASVKWLTRIEAVPEPFDGYFQSEKYQYERTRDGIEERVPVTLQGVRSLITEPSPDQEVAAGRLAIRGVAWSGTAAIARVEVSLGGGPWQAARLLGERHRHSWQWWELITELERSGVTTVRARATDLAGLTQPDQAEWNRLGYGANAIEAIRIVCR
jgi:DMSO/TMAO reductase YedYZ molybdopterin-dependent catalytic subunit